jgi:SAM-dependent methyltransferase
MPEQFAYVGQELDLFAHAIGWKKYWSSIVKPYLGAEVLEVGAGLGANTPLLFSPTQSKWICLEPDPRLVERLKENCRKLPNSERITIQTGTLAEVPMDGRFDTVLYIDVLEHIQDDAAELELAAKHLKPHGRIIVLSPAWQFLFSPFDKEIGHYRRYSTSSLAAIGPRSLVREKLLLLDSVGMLASLGNRLLLKQSMPTLKQIEFWNNWLLPVSRVLDPLLLFSIGKSVIGIWRRNTS